MSTDEDAGGLRAALEAGGERWEAPLERHAVLGSTNELLKERARAGAPALSVILADRQTAGRGRHGRGWTSPPGNLHVSVLLRAAPAVLGLVPLLGGVAAARGLSSFGVDARLKWPNDVLVGEGKLAGILAEASSGAAGTEWVVLGIGANLDPRGDLPEGATSLRRETGRGVAVEAACGVVLAQIRVWYHALASGREEELRAAWRERSIPWWGRAVLFRQGDATLTGVARDIDHDGALVIERPGGSLVRVVAGEVAQVRLEGPPPQGGGA